MNYQPTVDKIIEISKYLTFTCENILFRNGPFLKEGIYQNLLIHELQMNNIPTYRELVFGYKLTDSHGNNVAIGDGHSLRSDIEIPILSGILELKSSSSTTKYENIWQLRNYLENRKDRSWGAVINFISTSGKKSLSHIETTLLVKESYVKSDSEPLKIQTSLDDEITINKYFMLTLKSKEYPNQETIFIKFPNCIENENEDESIEENSNIVNLTSI